MKAYKLAVQANRAEQLLPIGYSTGKPLNMALLGYMESIVKQIVISKNNTYNTKEINVSTDE